MSKWFLFGFTSDSALCVFSLHHLLQTPEAGTRKQVGQLWRLEPPATSGLWKELPSEFWGKTSTKIQWETNFRWKGDRRAVLSLVWAPFCAINFVTELTLGPSLGTQRKASQKRGRFLDSTSEQDGGQHMKKAKLPLGQQDSCLMV